jgi:hypothetical protein
LHRHRADHLIVSIRSPVQAGVGSVFKVEQRDGVELALAILIKLNRGGIARLVDEPQGVEVIAEIPR